MLFRKGITIIRTSIPYHTLFSISLLSPSPPLTPHPLPTQAEFHKTGKYVEKRAEMAKDAVLGILSKLLTPLSSFLSNSTPYSLFLVDFDYGRFKKPTVWLKLLMFCFLVSSMVLVSSINTLGLHHIERKCCKIEGGWRN